MNKLTGKTKTVLFWACVFVFYTILVTKIDVKPIGPLGSCVGFAAFNGLFAKLFHYRWVWYIFSKIAAGLAFAIIGLYGFFGLIELIQRKKLLKVDRDILILGGFYIIVGIYYLMFTKIAINYRPVLLEDVLEPSFPSSHTVMGLCVFLSAEKLESLGKDGGNEFFRTCLKVLAAVTVVTRTLSGVHWMTDIIGGVIFSVFLLSIFNWALERFGAVKKRKTRRSPQPAAQTSQRK